MDKNIIKVLNNQTPLTEIKYEEKIITMKEEAFMTDKEIQTLSILIDDKCKQTKVKCKNCNCDSSECDSAKSSISSHDNILSKNAASNSGITNTSDSIIRSKNSVFNNGITNTSNSNINNNNSNDILLVTNNGTRWSNKFSAGKPSFYDASINNANASNNGTIHENDACYN